LFEDAHVLGHSNFAIKILVITCCHLLAFSQIGHHIVHSSFSFIKTTHALPVNISGQFFCCWTGCSMTLASHWIHDIMTSIHHGCTGFGPFCSTFVPPHPYGWSSNIRGSTPAALVAAVPSAEEDEGMVKYNSVNA
jgi:hypothetical protein